MAVKKPNKPVPGGDRGGASGENTKEKQCGEKKSCGCGSCGK